MFCKSWINLAKMLLFIVILYTVSLISDAAHLSNNSSSDLGNKAVQAVKVTQTSILIQWQSANKLLITTNLKPPQVMVYYSLVTSSSSVNNSLSWNSESIKIGLSSDHSNGTALIEHLKPDSQYLIKVVDEQFNETIKVKTKGGCFYNTTWYLVGDVFNQNCDLKCTCLPSFKVDCNERCNVKKMKESELIEGCKETPDPNDPECCIVYNCKDVILSGSRPKVLVTSRTMTSLKIAWDDFKLPNYQSGYVVDFRQAFNKTYHEWTQIQAENTPFWIIDNLIPGTDYEIKISVWDDLEAKKLSAAGSEVITVQTLDGCVSQNSTFANGDEFFEGCDFKCICKGSNLRDCKERCTKPYLKSGIANNNPECIEISSPDDECCVSIKCPIEDIEVKEYEGATFSDKPGFCPETDKIRDENGVCLDECQHDYHCTSSQKCCPTTCGGAICISALIGKSLCESVLCGPNAVCIVSNTSPSCACKPSFRGDPNDLAFGCKSNQTRSNLVCNYKNSTYGPGEEFFDGCTSKCICSEALEVECSPRCPFSSLAENENYNDQLCSIISDPKDACCKTLACESQPVSLIALNNSSKTISSTNDTIGDTMDVNMPLSTEGCHHNNHTFQPGESFNNDCESKCICKNGGHLHCMPRCPLFQGYDQKLCKLIPDPDDPECCKIAVCNVEDNVPPPKYNFSLILDSVRVYNSSNVIIRLIVSELKPNASKMLKFSIHYEIAEEKANSTDDSELNWNQFEIEKSNLLALDENIFEANLGNLKPLTEYYVKVVEKTFNLTSNTVFVKTYPLGIDSSFDGCFLGNQTFEVGESFYDGCEYKCTCREGGIRECDERCPTYIDTVGYENCEWKPAPDDECCIIPVCNPNEDPDSMLETRPQEFCTSPNGKLHPVGDVWEESVTSCIKASCRCIKLPNQTNTIECSGGCAPIPPEALKASLDCPSPKLITPEDECHCPYVVCNNNPIEIPPYLHDRHTQAIPRLPIQPHIGIEEGCKYNGRTVQVGKFYDGCRSVCQCHLNGRVNCIRVECPRFFEHTGEDCVDWELDPNFVPEPPNCCPVPRCKNDGSCNFAGLRVPNFKIIPEELLPCGTRCVCINSNVTCEHRCPPLNDTPPLNLPCPPSAAYQGYQGNDRCCLQWMCRGQERTAFCLHNGHRFTVGEQWDDPASANGLVSRRRCQCKLSDNENKPEVVCFPGICPKISERHLKQSPECPIPVLITPDDPILCPYVVCNYSEETGKELENVSIIAINSSAVRIRFTLPSLFVGLIGHAELHFTTDQDKPREQWNVQKFARPKRLFDTPNIEYHLATLNPGTTYFFQIRIIIEALHSGPESQIYKLYMPENFSSRKPAIGVPLTNQYNPLDFPNIMMIDANLNAIPVDHSSIKVIWRHFEGQEKRFIDGIMLRYKRTEDSSDNWVTTSMIHRDVNEYLLRDLLPGVSYTVDLVFKISDKILTKLVSSRSIVVDIPAKPKDDYDFNISIDPTSDISIYPHKVAMHLKHVPKPVNKFVNVARINYKATDSLDLGDKKMLQVYKVPSEDGIIVLDGLNPRKKYKAWVDMFLSNGQKVSSNAISFITKEETKLYRKYNDSSANEAEALRENHNTELVRPYYIALMIVAIFAILTGIGFIAVLCVLMKIKTSAKASITRAPSETAYDNPTYKTFDGEKITDETLKNGTAQL